MPKIKVILPAGYPEEDPFPLEESPLRINFKNTIMIVDGERIRSYDELVSLASRDRYRHQEFLEVAVVIAIAGG